MQRVYVAPAGETILVITGTVRTSAYDSHYRVGPRWTGSGDCTWLVPTPRSDASYLNHSCDANAVITAEQTLVAVSPLARGQEICIDYSTTEADPHWKMTCKCGTPPWRDARTEPGTDDSARTSWAEVTAGRMAARGITGRAFVPARVRLQRPALGRAARSVPDRSRGQLGPRGDGARPPDLRARRS